MISDSAIMPACIICKTRNAQFVIPTRVFQGPEMRYLGLKQGLTEARVEISIGLEQGLAEARVKISRTRVDQGLTGVRNEISRTRQVQGLKEARYEISRTRPVFLQELEMRYLGLDQGLTGARDEISRTRPGSNRS